MITSGTFAMSAGDNRLLTDDSRLFSIAEEFSAASRPGEGLTIVRRYDATVGGKLRVFVDGVDAGIWELPVGRSFFAESAFSVSPSMVNEPLTRLRFEVIPDKTAIAVSSFFYWILVPQNDS